MNMQGLLMKIVKIRTLQGGCPIKTAIYQGSDLSISTSLFATATEELTKVHKRWGAMVNVVIDNIIRPGVNDRLELQKQELEPQG